MKFWVGSNEQIHEADNKIKDMEGRKELIETIKK